MSSKLFLRSAISLYLFSIPVYGADMKNEIDHLLTFVANTECQYERNGTKHTGAEAAEHIKKKYRYYQDKISTAEKFIELSATKSTMSGKYYLIYCRGEPPVKSQGWLLRELKSYRKKCANKTISYSPTMRGNPHYASLCFG